MTETAVDMAQLFLSDASLRSDLIRAFTEDDILHVDELLRLLRSVQGDVRLDEVVAEIARRAPSLARKFAFGWSETVLAR